jgi:hypothetical protein
MRRVLIPVVALLIPMVLIGPVESKGQRKNGLRLIRMVRSLTGTHYWYQQVRSGYPVLGSYYARHFDLQGNLADVDDGRASISGGVPPAPEISAGLARRVAGGGATGLAVLDRRLPRLVWTVYSSEGVRTLVDAITGEVIRSDVVIKEATGQGRVFDPNPVVTLRDESLTDQKDADYPALQPAYFVRALTNLDGSGFLRGDFADVKGTKGRAFSSSLQFLFGRSATEFEQVMAYYDLTEAQKHIQSLGFTNVNNEPQDVKADQFGGDNSFFYPQQDFIKVGKGGVDDGEDAEVIWHEYGHAIQDDQVPGFGEGPEAGGIGEGFSDYWAVTMSVPVSGGFELPCVADWDSISYTDTVPHCLRRVDEDLHYPADLTESVHHNGQIWSRALWDIHLALGRDTADAIILEGQFAFAPDTSMPEAALDTVAAARALYGRRTAGVVRGAFEDRGIL